MVWVMWFVVFWCWVVKVVVWWVIVCCLDGVLYRCSVWVSVCLMLVVCSVVLVVLVRVEVLVKLKVCGFIIIG